MNENKNLLNYFVIGWIFFFFIISPVNLFAENNSSTANVDSVSNQQKYWISLEYSAAQGKGRSLPQVLQQQQVEDCFREVVILAA